jgi:outer membrane protein assembly factor BamB
MTISLVALPTGSAQGTRATYAFIGATPNPVGVNEQTLLHVGITQQLNSVAMGWEGLSVTVTKPDGSVETISNIRTDATGGTGVVYTPTMEGNYTLQTHFPEQVTTSTKVAGGTPVGTVMLASDSDILTLVVQEETEPFYPGVALPTEYWTRPINAQFREWYTISGSWLAAGSTIGEPAPYNDAPESPHVLWTKPLKIGGLVGGEFGLIGSGATSIAFNNGDPYQGLWSSRLIIAGVLIYISSETTGERPLKYTAMDVRTGEELWTATFLDNRTISMGQIFEWESYNSQGAWPYLWVTVGNDWTAFSPYDAQPRFTITNVTSGTNLIDNYGRIYRYTVSLSGGYMQLWNMSALISMAGGWGSNNYPGPYGTYNASATLSNGTLTAAAQRAWSWNITIPKGLQGSVRAVALDDRVVGSNLNLTDVNIWAFSLKKGQEGTLLYNNDWKAPSKWNAGNLSLSWGATSLTDNVAVVWSKEERCHYGFSLANGNYLWVTDSEHYLDIYDAGRTIYEGKLFSVGQAGIVYCFNLTTGKIMWTYEGNDPYTEILWSNNWPVDQYFPCGGKIYFFMQTHSDNQPLPRGAPAYCLNATTGEVIWRVDGLLRDTHWGSEAIMGDSVIVTSNTYDQQMYAIGKGPSETTVTAGPEVSVEGSSVLVKGMVTDVSPGTKQTAVTLRFPKGVPAVSDESVGEWMKYVYVQFPRPANVTGVEVVVEVLDPNNNYYEVGRATSDASGMFSCAFNPPVPGKYTIYATFTGSKSYYGSYAETAINVDSAPAATPAPTPTPIPMSELYFVPAVSGIVVAIVIVGILLALLLLRKH